MGGNQSLPKVTPQDKAILDLKLQRDKLKQYQKNIQGILDREFEIAKAQLAAGRKDRATIALRRRKYQQGLLQKTDGQLQNLEELASISLTDVLTRLTIIKVSTIEFSLVEVSVLHGLKQGNDVLKEIHKELNVEAVEKLLDETHEAREYQREIGDMLANTLSLDDEDDVQRELLALQAEDEDIRTRNAVEQLPKAPVDQPVPTDKEPVTADKEPVKSGRTRIPVAA